MIHIVSCTDNNYVMPLGVAMTSAFINCQSSVTYHIITTDVVSDKNKAKLLECAKRYKGQVVFYDIKSEVLAQLPIRKTGYLSAACYVRIFIEQLLPAEIERVIYLDCDLIVNQDLIELWSTPMIGKAAGVVYDSIAKEEFYERLMYDRSYKYFNSGVMLINLKYWREHCIMKQCLDFIQRYPNQIVCEDQDVLNAVLHENVLYLPIKYNAICTVFFKENQFPPEYSKEVEEAKTNPIIVHYSWIKPWHRECDHTLVGLFFKYQKLTPWKGQKRVFFTKDRYQQLKFIIKGMLWNCRLLRRVSPYC